MSAPKKTQAGARKKPLAFWRDRRGAAAVEFAFIAPVLIIMYCGLAELSQAMMAQRRASNVASTIGDLVAQSTQTGPTMIGDIFNIGNTINRETRDVPGIQIVLNDKLFEHVWFRL